MRFLIRTLFALLLPAALLADGPLSSSTFPNGATVKKALTVQGGTVTNSAPVLNATQTWNGTGSTVFTGLQYNATDTSSSASSLLLDLQVGGSSKFKVRKDGYLTIGAFLDIGTTSAFSFLNRASLRSPADGQLQISDFNATKNVYLVTDSNHRLAMRSGSNGQAFEVDGDYTDISNYSRGVIDAQTAGVVKIGSEKLGSGTTRAVQFISPSNFGFNGTSFGSGTGVLFIANATAPSSNPTGGGILYVEAGALKYRGSSGTVTTLAVP